MHSLRSTLRPVVQSAVSSVKLLRADTGYDDRLMLIDKTHNNLAVCLAHKTTSVPVQLALLSFSQVLSIELTTPRLVWYGIRMSLDSERTRTRRCLAALRLASNVDRRWMSIHLEVAARGKETTNCGSRDRVGRLFLNRGRSRGGGRNGEMPPPQRLADRLPFAPHSPADRW